MVGIKFLAKDQVLGSKLINAYIDYTNESLIKNIDDEGIILRDNEQQRIETKITSLRNNAAIKKAVQLVQLTDAYQIASAMEITNPTTIEALTHKGDKVNSQINVGNTDKDILALMGTNYLRNEITALQNRPDSAGLFVEQIQELKQQLASIKTEEDKKQFKALIANDAYIGGYSDFMARFTELSNLTFDFINVKCFSFDKIAKISGNEVKSNKKMIVSLGFVISAMLAVFSVLIMNAKQKQP
jgi:LPS O-antigen subunit length determinant protein (WzzB/FepE family)